MLFLLSASRLPSWPVARLRWPGAAFAGSLTLRRVRHRVVMVVRPLPPAFNRSLRRLGRDQSVAPADQIAPPRLDQGLPHLEVVLRLEDLHEGPRVLAVLRIADFPPIPIRHWLLGWHTLVDSSVSFVRDSIPGTTWRALESVAGRDY